MNLKNVYLVFLLLIALCGGVLAQSGTGTIQGTVTDNSGAVLPSAKVTVTNINTNVTRSDVTDSTGNYSFPSLALGPYRVQVEASGMGKQVVNNLVLEVGRTVAQNFSLKPAQVEQTIEITAETPVIESTTMTVGQVVDNRTVQEISLNGRHIVELTGLVPGTVVPPVNGFLTAPLRGQGSFGVNTAGGREDTTNFMVNGINLNDMANGQVTFQPSINTVAEFKMDNSTNSAEFGRNSGSQMMVATRSGTNAFHGEVFEFIRNHDLDARNFFNPSGQPQSTFKRNNFGANLGGPIFRNKTFFFLSYEGLRQRQGVTVNNSVLTNAQRAQIVANNNPTMQQFLKLIPVANDSTGTKFQGSLVAPVNLDQGTADISHNFSDADRLHGYYAIQQDTRGEPVLQGGTVPGAGDHRTSRRQIFTFNETHVFNPSVVNEVRFGINRIHIVFAPESSLDPSQLGLNNGATGPIGAPQVSVGGLGLQFGGINGFPQGRGDYTGVLSDTLSWQHGRHSFKYGGEVRRFNGNSFTSTPGTLGFASVTTFIAAQPNAFTITTGNRPARVYMNALGLFGMDSYKIKPYLTLELGLRWEWNMTPTEARDRGSLFVAEKDWLVQVNTNGRDGIYHQNNKLFEPRVGFAWDLFHNGKTILRSGYAILYDQPLPYNANLAANFPYANPVSFTPTAGKPTTSFTTLLADAKGSGLTLNDINRNYNNDYIQSYNLNLQQQITPTLGIMIGYFGNKGTHQDMSLNLNQQVQQAGAAPGTYVRPFANLASTSPIAPGTALGNINERNSIGTSNYNALWATVTKRVSHNLQFAGNYTWSKSLDENSRNGLGVADSTRPFLDYGPSDFDARHHFTFSGLYTLPFKANRLVSGWRVSTIVTLQSGNPLNLTAGNPSNSATNTSISGFTSGALRPDLIGPMPKVGKTLIFSGTQAGNVQWFTFGNTLICDPTSPSSCTGSSVFALPVALVGGKNLYHFGNVSRNSMVGPDFKNVDFSLTKTTKITERFSHEFRVEAFDVFNHPNFSNPGTSAQLGSTTFGVIKATRGPNGDAGSSRQIQFAMKLIF
jgi:hypothetical protein